MIQMNLRTWVLTSILITIVGLSDRARCLPVLLVVDVTDPSNVTITSTYADSFENSSTTSTYDGVDLLNFLTSAAVADPVAVGGLTPAGTSLSYDSWGTDSYSGTSVDINLYSSNSKFTDANLHHRQPGLYRLLDGPQFVRVYRTISALRDDRSNFGRFIAGIRTRLSASGWLCRSPRNTAFSSFWRSPDSSR